MACLLLCCAADKVEQDVQQLVNAMTLSSLSLADGAERFLEDNVVAQCVLCRSCLRSDLLFSVWCAEPCLCGDAFRRSSS